MFLPVPKFLRNINHFEREDGTPLHYQLVNLKDWCKNRFEVVNQLHLNTCSSFHRYDVILLINGLPLMQIELKSLQIKPASRHAADRRLQKGPRQRLYQHAAMLYAAFCG